jgi:hypothetical protein
MDIEKKKVLKNVKYNFREQKIIKLQTEIEIIKTEIEIIKTEFKIIKNEFQIIKTEIKLINNKNIHSQANRRNHILLL